MWVSFFQEKFEAFEAFKSFKARVEKEIVSFIKTFRIDRGGEYCSKAFEQFCDVQGIQRELTAAYSPQQNGVSDRKHRTILNIVRSLLARGKIAKSFWPEAVNWSVHVFNRSPTFFIQIMTSEEAWNRRKPAVDHFRLFGYIAYAHVPNEKGKKLNDKGEKCVFLAVSDASKAYKLFNPLTKKIVTNRGVVFYEENTWNWGGQQLTAVILDNETHELQDQHISIVSEPEVSTNDTQNDAPIATEASPIVAERINTNPESQ
ncbi:hypothetical protein LguiB_029910 [Lonicera macranthoides]